MNAKMLIRRESVNPHISASNKKQGEKAFLIQAILRKSSTCVLYYQWNTHGSNCLRTV